MTVTNTDIARDGGSPSAAPSPAAAARAIPLSCYIRTLNEAHRIGPVVRAALKAASEVVVVDSGSKDGTVEAAKAAGARVIHNPWPGNGYQKRVGEEACSHDWLLDLDADEVIDDELAASIRALFANGEPQASMYALKLVIAPPAGEPWRDFALTWRAKLYDRRRHRMPADEMWDQLEEKRSAKPPRLDGAILHYSFTDLKDFIAKLNRGSSNRAARMKPRSIPALGLRILFGFPVYFTKTYLARGYWRGGLYGFVVATILANARWQRDAKMFEQALMERDRKAGRTRGIGP